MFRNTRCLVTGGTGMIGRQVVKLLYEAGAEVTSVSLDELRPVDGVEYIRGDLCDFNLCLNQTRKRDYVFHIAGMKASPRITDMRPGTFFAKLLQMNTNVLEACRQNGVPNLVYTSSIGAYSQDSVLTENNWFNGEPMDTYPGWAKRMGEYQIEAYAKEYGLKWIAIRLSNVYGIGDIFSKSAMIIPSLMTRIRSGEDPIKLWDNGKGVRDFVYSWDVAKGIIQAIKAPKMFYNLGGVSAYSVGELVKKLQGIVSFNCEFDRDKPKFPTRLMSSDLATKDFGYYPSTSLSEGLKETWEWYLQSKEERYDYFSRV